MGAEYSGADQEIDALISTSLGNYKFVVISNSTSGTQKVLFSLYNPSGSQLGSTINTNSLSGGTRTIYIQLVRTLTSFQISYTTSSSFTGLTLFYDSSATTLTMNDAIKFIAPNPTYSVYDWTYIYNFSVYATLATISNTSIDVGGPAILRNGVNISSGTLTLSGTMSTYYTTYGQNLNLTGVGTRGGATYFDFLSATNTYSSATSPTKFFRIDPTGQFQIINNAYTSVILKLDDNGNMIIPGGLTLNSGLNYRSYTGFLFIGSSTTLTAGQNGYMIQQAANITLPLGSTVPLGGTYSFVNHGGSSYTITVNNTSTEFIYNGGSLGTSTRSIAIQPGESLELMSRGSTEWDVTNGTASLRYQATPPVLKVSAANQAATTTISLNTIKAYMATDGTLWLGSNTGSAISVYGQAQWTFFGSSGAGSTISLGSLNALANATTCPTSGTRGDLMVAVVTDTTNSVTYRITGQQTGPAKTGNYTIVIEQIA